MKSASEKKRAPSFGSFCVRLFTHLCTLHLLSCIPRVFSRINRQIAREKAELKYQQSGGYEFKFSLAHAFDERLRATRRLGRGGKSVREQLMNILGDDGTRVVEGKEGEEKQRAALRVIEKALGDFHVEDLGLDFLQGSVSTSMNVSASESMDLSLIHISEPTRPY